MRNVVVAGATGLIGAEVLKQLVSRRDVKVFALVRKAGAKALPTGVAEIPFEFGSAGYKRLGTEIPCDSLLCCVGSTMKQAGSKAAFQKIERDIPLALAARLQALGGSTVFGFVSSAGAGKPVGFYLKNKAEVETGLGVAGISRVIVRPSLLLGERAEFRFGEKLAVVAMPPVMNVVSALTLGKFAAVGRLLPIKAERVARTLIKYSVDEPVRGEKIVEGYDFEA